MALARQVWIGQRQPFMRNMLTRIGFIDETSLKTNMAKTTGWAPCVARLVDHAPFGHWQTQTPAFAGAGSSSPPCAMIGWMRPGSSAAR